MYGAIHLDVAAFVSEQRTDFMRASDANGRYDGEGMCGRLACYERERRSRHTGEESLL